MWVSTSPDIAGWPQLTGQLFYSHTPMSTAVVRSPSEPTGSVSDFTDATLCT